MTTIAIQQDKVASKPLFIHKYNKAALVSFLLALLFASYFVIPHDSFLYPLYKFSILFVVVLPALTFILSILSVRQIMTTHERGATLSYIALSMTSLYLIAGMAIPFVLIGLYIVYSYII